MKTLILTLAAAGALAVPAWAQDTQTTVDQPELGNITCEGFAAMDEAGQTTTFEALVASMAADDETAADDGTADASADTASTDAASTDTADAASTDAASTDTADAASTDTADAAGAMDPMMAAVLEACAADPMQTVADVMTQVGAGEAASGN